MQSLLTTFPFEVLNSMFDSLFVGFSLISRIDMYAEIGILKPIVHNLIFQSLSFSICQTYELKMKTPFAFFELELGLEKWSRTKDAQNHSIKVGYVKSVSCFS
ncbi:hypothetical protein VNO77_18240 [Canavalia gladiata]|uniref:Uncharacterized protein n=1 Tax=Canavalia gladiata TaxID=3824 RepID=A0AAN9QHG2_CANGL